MDLSSKLASNSEVIAELFQRMGSFEERLQSATATSPSSPAHTDLTALAREFSSFKTSVWQALTRLKNQTDLLSLGLDRHETFLRRKVLLFHGVAESKEEKVNEVVLKILSDKLKLPDLTLSDLQACHRLGASAAKPRPILVRFRELECRRLAWDSKTELKGSGIIISEFLTKARHDVFMAARKHFGVSGCWSSEGKIIILLPDKTRCKIEVQSELQNLIDSNPVAKGSAAIPEASPKVTPAEKATPSQPVKLRSKPSSLAASRKLRLRPT